MVFIILQSVEYHLRLWQLMQDMRHTFTRDKHVKQ